MVDHNERLLSPVELAARNNAEWCDAVCRAHGLPGTFDDDMWVNAGEVPMYYPNVVTLRPAEDVGDWRTRLEKLIGSRSGAWSVKDSYDDLDLSLLGFEKLFTAQWLLAPTAVTGQRETRIVTKPEDLKAWEHTWSAGESEGLFTEPLLLGGRIKFIAVYEDGKIVAGAAVNKSDTAVGITNIFCRSGQPEEYWLACVAAAQAEFAGLPVIDYEHGDELALAERIGFQRLGPLSVWLKD